MKHNNLLLAIIILGVLAIAITSYLVYIHFYADFTGLCQEGTALDCNFVNQSKYAMMWGLPIALWGLLFYIGFFLFALALYLGLDLREVHRKLNRKHAYWLVFLIPLFGFIFSLRLTFIEAFILKAWCPFCVIQQVVVFFMLIISVILLKQRHIAFD